MSHIGNLGHSAILFPASLIVFGCLLWLGRRADAIAFAAALTAGVLATLVAKLTIYTCEPRTPWLGIESPSGHASFSAAFYGCIALLAGAGRPLWQRIGVYGVTILFVVLVGLSRIVVEVHTVPDVIAGTGIGAAAVLLFQMLRGPPRPIVIPLRVIALGVPASAVLVVTILIFARHWTPEGFIERVGSRLDRALGVCTSL
jgi:membrane-associated phospholipid phosphatase